MKLFRLKSLKLNIVIEDIHTLIWIGYIIYKIRYGEYLHDYIIYYEEGGCPVTEPSKGST